MSCQHKFTYTYTQRSFKTLVILYSIRFFSHWFDSHNWKIFVWWAWLFCSIWVFWVWKYLSTFYKKKKNDIPPMRNLRIWASKRHLLKFYRWLLSEIQHGLTAGDKTNICGTGKVAKFFAPSAILICLFEIGRFIQMINQYMKETHLINK